MRLERSSIMRFNGVEVSHFNSRHLSSTPTLCKSLLRNCTTRDGASVACLINVTVTITIFVQFADSDNQSLRRRLRDAPAFHHKTPVLMRFLQSSKKSHWVVFLCAPCMALGTAIGAE